MKCTEVELLFVSLWHVSYSDSTEEEKERKETLMGKDDNPGRDEKQDYGIENKASQGGRLTGSGSPPTSASSK